MGGLALAPASVAQGGAVQVVTPAPNWSVARVPGQVLVVGAGSQGAGGLSTQGLKALSGIQTQQVTEDLTVALTPAGLTDAAFAGQLQAAGLQVQPNFVYRALALPNDPGLPGNAGINVPYTDVQGKSQSINVKQTYFNRIKLQDAWDFLGNCGKMPLGAKTAVLDTAVDATHAELMGQLAVQVSYLPAGSTSIKAHGTATTGLIGAKTNNAGGVAGVTWGTPLVTVEVLNGDGDGTTTTIVKALNYAVQQGAKVINMSLGGRAAAGDPGDLALNNAIAAAVSPTGGDAVIVAAAGNTPGDGVYYPASNPNVIAVGAVGASDSSLSCYSARASATLPRKLDIVAPGGAGYLACSGATVSQDLLLLSPGSKYVLEAGTSFAAPLVSGVAALIRGANPKLTAAQTKALLLGNVNATSGLPLLDANAAIRAATK